MENATFKDVRETFYAIVDTGYVSESNLVSKTTALVRAGAGIVQLRAKKNTPDERRKMAFKLLPLFEDFSYAPEIASGDFPKPVFVINDDVFLACEIGNHIPNFGLHVGQDDTPPSEARRILGKNALIGLSTHSIEQALNAQKLEGIIDYFAVGPVYATNTKPGRKAVGLELVEAVAKTNPEKIPWYAIGGIHTNNAGLVRRAGAARFVAVSDVLEKPDTLEAVRSLVGDFLA